jgi:hypothetical protein
MSRECVARENWPSYGGGCPCRRCRERTLDRLADRSLSVALAHAQNRAEAAESGRFGDELTIDKDISVIWSRRANLATWLAAPTRPGDTPPNRSGQWLYKFFLVGATQPLYIGRVTGRKLTTRISEHLRKRTPIRGLTFANVGQVITRNKADLRNKVPGAKTSSQMIDEILSSLPHNQFEISFAEVKRLGRGGRPTRAFAADAALAEKHFHRKNAARINTRDDPRFEAANLAGVPGDDPALARLVRRVAAALAARGSGRSERRM